MLKRKYKPKEKASTIELINLVLGILNAIAIIKSLLK